jgi:hypothetical protein
VVVWLATPLLTIWFRYDPAQYASRRPNTILHALKYDAVHDRDQDVIALTATLRREARVI